MSQASAFDVFQVQANNDLMEIFKPYPKPWKVTAPAYLEKYLWSLLTTEICGNEVSITPISNVGLSKEPKSLFAVVPADMEVVENICQTLKAVPNDIRTLLVIPRISEFVRQAVDNSGLVGVSSLSELSESAEERENQVIVTEFHADFHFVDTDFFLLPCTRTLFHSVIEKDYSDLYAGARALAKIQMVFGGIPHVVTVGAHADIVKNLMDGILDQAGCSTEGVPQIGTLIIIDRMVDPVTPMATPVPIEGLIDEFFGMEYGWYIREPEKDWQIGEKDPVFRKMRCLSISEACEITKTGEIYESVDEAKSESLKRLIGAWNESRQHQAVEYISNVWDEVEKRNLQLVLKEEGKLMMCDDSIVKLAMNYLTVLGDIRTALRLTYLDRFVLGKKSVSNKANEMKTLIKELVSECGLSALETIATLEKMRSAMPEKWSWKDIRDGLHCCDEKDPMHDLCDKFIPPVVQIVKRITQGDIVGLKKILSSHTPVNSVERDGAKADSKNGKNILVFFVGGVTLGEVGFIRRMGSLVFKNEVSYIMGATNQLKPRVFLDELTPGLFDERKMFEGSESSKSEQST